MRLSEPATSETDPGAAPLDAAGFARLMAPLGPFEPAPRIAVAVSGGADGLALALLAADWAAARGGEAVAVTVDHGLRPEAAAEARQVRRWLAARGMSHSILPWRGPRPATDVQAAARAARYRLMGDWCARRGILHLLLAHHRDDQAETMLLRLARGSGLDGLAAMAPAAELPASTGAPPPGIRLLRPLLAVPKAALEAVLRQAGQDWIEDPSNRSEAFARARLRGLLPLLAAEGLTVERLAATAGHLARARAALDDAVAALAAEAVSVHPAGYAVLRLDAYRLAPEETALRCLSRCLATIGGADYPPRFDRLERLHGELTAPVGGGRARARTLGGCRIELGGDHARICRELAGIVEETPVGPARTVWWDRRFLLRFAGTGRARVAALGQDGWRRLLAEAPTLRRTALPAAVRPSLPALRDEAGLLEVPHLGWRRPGARGIRVRAVEFAPARAVAPACFMVV